MIITLNPLTDERYRTFVNEHPSATVFHTPEWLRVLHETYGFTPGCAAIENGNDLHGVLPYMVTRGFSGKTRVVSLPFSDFCEPLLSDRIDFDGVLDAMAHNHPKASGIDIRGGKALLGNVVAGQSVVMHTVNCIPDEDALFHSLKHTVRRNIKKAEREGLLCTFETTLEAVQKFYHLNCITRRDHGLPPQPWKFFKNIWCHFINGGKGFVVTVQYNGKAIASALFLVFGQNVYYKYGASVKKHQQFRPNDLIIWKSLLYCNKMNYTSLNLGRTEPAHTGLLRFKQGWGGMESVVHYFRYNKNMSAFIPINKTVFDTICMGLFSKMPMVFLKPIGSFIHQFAG